MASQGPPLPPPLPPPPPPPSAPWHAPVDPGARFAQGAVAGPSAGAVSALRKPGLSCAECRRSKLKCDRVFPCSSCIRRGCAAICPEGALSATKGNKVLVARVEKLSTQVKNMSTRIRELEAALGEAQTHIGKQGHPLLATAVKWEEPDDVGLPPESDGESANGMQFFDEAEDEAEEDSLQQEMSSLSMHHLGLPAEVMTLAIAFPLGVSECPSSQTLFYQFIPRRPQVNELAALYYTYSAWMYDPVPRLELETLLDDVYGPDRDGVHVHSLAVLFMVLCIGTLFDTANADHELWTERYHALARAALSFHSIVHHRSCTTVQAIVLLNIYKYINPKPSPEYRWLMSGICARAAQAIGLQRDCGGWGLPGEEVQRRRVVFWNMFVFETWTSFLSGRPSMLNLRQISARFPEDRESVRYNGDAEISFHSWLFRFVAGCMSLASQHVFSTRKPTYEQLLELDTKIRSFPVPRHLRTPCEHPATPWADAPDAAIQQLCQYGSVENTLLYLHRSYFAQARGEPSQEMYGRSFWAVFRSSARLIRSLRSLWHRHPDVTSKVWYSWSSYYSACMALGCLVLDKPWCQLSPHALALLKDAAVVYEQGSSTYIPSTLRLLQQMVERADAASLQYTHHGPRRKCGPDCCATLGADDVRRFADGTDETIPGENDKPSPRTRYSSASPPASSAAAEPALGMASVHAALAPPAPPTGAYSGYGQFVPADSDTTPTGGAPESRPPAFASQTAEPWFYTPAAAHAAHALENHTPSVQAFRGLEPYPASAGYVPGTSLTHGTAPFAVHNYHPQFGTPSPSAPSGFHHQHHPDQGNWA